MQLTPHHIAALALAYNLAPPSGADNAALREAGMIEPHYTDAGTLDGWQLTARGTAWINAALAIPLPVQAWIIPGEGVTCAK